jgi:hypothetical protein
MTPDTIADAQCADLEKQLAALRDEADIHHELETNQHRRALLEARLETIRFSSHTLKTLDPKIAAETEVRDVLTACRTTLCDELLACPQRPRTARDFGKERNLSLSIQVIDRGIGVLTDTGFALSTLRLGQLLRDAGYVEGPRIENQIAGDFPWFGSLPEVERRLQLLLAQRTDAQARLAAAQESV